MNHLTEQALEEVKTAAKEFELAAFELARKGQVLEEKLAAVNAALVIERAKEAE